MAPRKEDRKPCACGCGGTTKTGHFLPGHDQKLRASIERAAGGLENLKRIVERQMGITIQVEPTAMPTGAGFRNGETRTTTIGYVNRNRQKNHGTRGVAGTDHGQVAYRLECLACGHTYGANGTDVFQRRCPYCQGGNPGIEF